MCQRQVTERRVNGLIEAWQRRREAKRKSRILLAVLEEESTGQLALVALCIVQVSDELVRIVGAIAGYGRLSGSGILGRGDEKASVGARQVEEIQRGRSDIGAIGSNDLSGYRARFACERRAQRSLRPIRKASQF